MCFLIIAYKNHNCHFIDPYLAFKYKQYGYALTLKAPKGIHWSHQMDVYVFMKAYKLMIATLWIHTWHLNISNSAMP